jgi:hypothetical protein
VKPGFELAGLAEQAELRVAKLVGGVALGVMGALVLGLAWSC